MKKKTIILIDGEHYPSAIKQTVIHLSKSKEFQPLAAVFMGGEEKIGHLEDLSSINLPIIREKNSKEALLKAIKIYQPQIILDISDEPVLGYKERLLYGSIILASGITYQGSDFQFDPLKFHKILNKPSISIIGTGKRVGKTAISAYISREIKKSGYRPCVIAMGRGGPDYPEILNEKKIKLNPKILLKHSQMGKHSASDYYEDFLMSRITSIGCFRCGGGLVGKPYFSNIKDGAKIANQLKENFVIVEGSGACIPPLETEKRIVVCGANQPLEYIAGYFGAYRIMISDLAIITMCERPIAERKKINQIEKQILELNPGIKTVETIFRPNPLKNIKGRKIFLALTAQPEIGKTIKKYLENRYECQVVYTSPFLAHRQQLKNDIISQKGKFDLMLTELKAAGVDIATSLALSMNIPVVYMDNIPMTISKDRPLKDLVLEMAREAETGYKEKNAHKKRTAQNPN